MKFIPKSLFILFCIFVPFFFITFVLMQNGSVSLSYEGFAIDSQNNLYIGREEGKLGVYRDGEWVRTISLMTSKGYSFTIKDDRLIVAALLHVYTLDLEGNEISVEEDRTTEILNKIRRERKTFQSSDGKVYRLKNVLGYYYICDDSGDIIYKMPTLDYIIKILYIIIGISFFICVPLTVIKWRKSMYNGRIFP